MFAFSLDLSWVHAFWNINEMYLGAGDCTVAKDTIKYLWNLSLWMALAQQYISLQRSMQFLIYVASDIHITIGLNCVSVGFSASIHHLPLLLLFSINFFQKPFHFKYVWHEEIYLGSIWRELTFIEYSVYFRCFI